MKHTFALHRARINKVLILLYLTLAARAPRIVIYVKQ